MKKYYYPLFFSVLAISAAQSTVIVDGVGGGGNFATLQQGVDAAIASPSETVVEIRTNVLAAGATVTPGTTLVRPLTIQAGSGFTPVISGPLVLTPANQDQLVSIVQLTVHPTTGNTDAVTISTNTNISSSTITGGPGVSLGINASIASAGTVAQLNVTGSTITGWYAVFAGRSVRDYAFTDSKILAADITNGFNYGFLLAGNRQVDRGAGVGADLGGTIEQGRTLTLDRCTVIAGKPIAWPVPDFVMLPKVMGNTTLTNCFINCSADSANYIGSYGTTYPASGSNTTHIFTHCTFHKGMLVLDANNLDPMTCIFRNNLFDMPNVSIAAVPIYNPEVMTFTGSTTNGFNLPPFNTYNPSDNSTLRFMDFSSATVPRPAVPVGTELVRTVNTPTEFIVDEAGNLMTDGITAFANKGAVSPVIIDVHGQPRPRGGASNDLGSDEVNEITSPSAVNDWNLY